MRYISSQKEGDGEAPIRIVGLCTSLANAKDLGEWVGATSHGLFNFPPGALRGAGSCADYDCLLAFGSWIEVQRHSMHCSTLHNTNASQLGGQYGLHEMSCGRTAATLMTLKRLLERCAGVRPVPLDIHVQGFDISNFESRMQARSLLVTDGALTDHSRSARGVRGA